MVEQSDHNPFILINTFTAVEGGIDALIEFQISEMQDMSADATAHGWLGNEVYRSDDGTGLVVLTRFRSVEARDRWAQTDRFRRHVEHLQPLVENVESIPVTFLAAHGESVSSRGGEPDP